MESHIKACFGENRKAVAKFDKNMSMISQQKLEAIQQNNGKITQPGPTTGVQNNGRMTPKALESGGVVSLIKAQRTRV